MLYKVVPNFEFVNEIQGGSNLILSLRVKSLSVTIQMKATEQYCHVVLFIMLYTGYC